MKMPVILTIEDEMSPLGRPPTIRMWSQGQRRMVEEAGLKILGSFVMSEPEEESDEWWDE